MVLKNCFKHLKYNIKEYDFPISSVYNHKIKSHHQLIFFPLRCSKQDLSLFLQKIQVRQSNPSVMSSRWPHTCNELNTLKYFIFSKWQRLTTSQSYFPDGVMNLLTLHFHHVPCLEKSVFNLSNTNRASTLCPLMLDSAVPSQQILHILFRANKLISSLINHIETFNETLMFFDFFISILFMSSVKKRRICIHQK